MNSNFDKKAYTKSGALKKNTILSNRAIKEPLIRFEETENSPQTFVAQVRQEKRVINRITHLVSILHQEFDNMPHKYKKDFNMRVELNQPRNLLSPRVIFKFGSGAHGQKRVSKTLGRVEDVWAALFSLAEQESVTKTFHVLPETAVNDVLAMYDPDNPFVPTKRQNPATKNRFP